MPEQPRCARDDKMRVEGPDFICIGLPKAATGWLYDQLQFHPDFWMPPVKELGYLNHEISRFRGSEQRLFRLENDVIHKRQDRERVRRQDLDRRRRSTERDIRFLRAVCRLRGQARDWAWYMELYSVKGDQLSGDIAPSSCRLKEDMIAETAAKLPSTKILLLVRDPISRIWSDLSMAHRKGYFDALLLENPKDFRATLEKRRMIQMPSRPTAIAPRWQRHVAPSHFRYILFDEIVANPLGTLEEILGYLGTDAKKERCGSQA
jgi:hypothetical protein